MQLNVAQGKGLPRRIELEAASPAEARQQAEHQGYTVLSCRPAGWNWIALTASRRSRNPLDVAVFIEHRLRVPGMVGSAR